MRLVLYIFHRAIKTDFIENTPILIVMFNYFRFLFNSYFSYFQCEPKYGLFAPVHKIQKVADAEEEKSVTPVTSPVTEPANESVPVTPVQVEVSTEEFSFSAKEEDREQKTPVRVQ